VRASWVSVLWEELVGEVGSELCPGGGCSSREWIKGVSECVNIFARPDSSRSSNEDKVHAINERMS